MPKIARLIIDRKHSGYVISVYQYAARGRQSLHSRSTVSGRADLRSPEFATLVQEAIKGRPTPEAAPQSPLNLPKTGGSPNVA